MAETVEYAGADKAKINITTSAVPVPGNFEQPRAVSPASSTTMSQPGARTPGTDEETQAVPPVWGQHRVVHEVEPDVKQININIQINIPSTFKLPSFGRGNCKWARGQKCERKPVRRILALVFFLLYLSFMICGAVAWGIQDREWMPEVCHPPLIFATFLPFFDAFATVSTIRMLLRHRDSDRPRFRYALNFMLHFVLTVFHTTVLVFGATWAEDESHYYYSRQPKRTIAGLIIYNASAMLLIKIILLLFVLKNGGLRRNIKQSVTQFPSMVKKEVEYERLTAGCDEDANQIPSARSSTEGRIFLS